MLTSWEVVANGAGSQVLSGSWASVFLSSHESTFFFLYVLSSLHVLSSIVCYLTLWAFSYCTYFLLTGLASLVLSATTAAFGVFLDTEKYSGTLWSY